MTGQTYDHPLFPGEKFAVANEHGWMSRSDQLWALPKGAKKGPMCGEWCPPDWGWPPVVCTDHGDGYHAASVDIGPYGPRIICVWLESPREDVS